MSKIKTGSDKVDYVLDGGIPENSTNMVIGLPGTGKTILAASVIFANATPEKRALYISTASEPLDKMIRYMQNFSFFRTESIGDSVIYEDLSDTLRQESLKGASEKLKTLIKEHQPAFLVIDSFKALHDFSPSVEGFRRCLSEISAVSTSLSITSFWVGEYSTEEMPRLPEFAVADGIIALAIRNTGAKDARYLRVLKMRGTDFIGGEHAYKISQDGLRLFPRLTTPSAHIDYGQTQMRSRTGVEVLDEMIAEGFWKGSSTVMFGPPGSGKTLLGLHFVFKGIEIGEKGLIATMQENPTQLARIAKGFGWDLEESINNGMLELFYISPIEVYIDEFIQQITDIAKSKGIERIMLDSISDLDIACHDKHRFRDYMYALVQQMAVDGISIIMTNEVRDLFSTSCVSEFGISHMSDNVVLLHYLRRESEVQRAILVLKTRASSHDPAIRQFSISTKGIKIGAEFRVKTNFSS